jgi:RHS repeat-associated protein
MKQAQPSTTETKAALRLVSAGKTATGVFDTWSGANLKETQSFTPKLRWGVRYSQSDPLGEIAGPNLYSYALNNPQNLVDPLGLPTCVIFVVEPNIEVGDIIAGMGTHHTLVWSEGCGGEPFLYDPSGSYRHRERGSAGLFFGEESSLHPCQEKQS